MVTTADTRQRELVKCDGCGILSRHWHRICLSSDGQVVFDVSLCRACASDTTSAVKMVWQALQVKP